MTVLAGIATPQDLRRLTSSQVRELAGEIREYLVSSVSRTGGHLGPNLGVVELTIALHRVFDSPHESVIFDTGHQCYVHKLLTGRQDFSALRKAGGVSGYPSRAESEHDVVENSHASTSLAWAEGIARARRLRGESQRSTVAVIGDGALTGGMAWEALNNIAADKDLPLVVVVNDNERSYAPTAGGLAEHLSTLRMTQGYERFLEWGRDTLHRTPVVGRQMYDTLHGMKKGLKDMVAPQGMFEDLGLKYVGPVDGHDVAAVENALRLAKEFGGPVLVHVLTQKGRGYEPARNDINDQFHAVGVIDPETGLPTRLPGRMWTDVFSDEICAIGERRPDVVALTAAMLIPVGLQGFQERFPARIFDVGIAEQHAVTMACGLAYGGMHPVVAIYATFLNRAFDQVLMDCALHQQGITFVLDRAGITGDDGASHNGMWDMALLASVPGLRLAAPRDPQQLVSLLNEAVEVPNAPTVVRFPKGVAGEPIPASQRVGTVDVLRGAPENAMDVLFVSVGALASETLAAARAVERLGLSCAVVDPRWVMPVAADVVEMASRATLVVVVEDGLREGGVGSAVSDAVADAGCAVPVVRCGVPRSFLPHAARSAVLADVGLDAEGIAAAASAAWSRFGLVPRVAAVESASGECNGVARAS